MQSELDILIVKLWDKANGQPDYDKKEWQKLQLAVEDLQRQVRESTGPRNAAQRSVVQSKG